MSEPLEGVFDSIDFNITFNLGECRKPRLDAEHVEDLRKSGWNSTTARELGVFSATAESIGQLIAPWKPLIGMSLLVFPIPDRPGLYIGKPFPALTDKDGRTVKYIAPPGSGSPLYVTPTAKNVLTDITVPLCITEGVKKAAKAHQHGIPCVSISGVWQWMEHGEPIEELKQIALHGRDVYIIIDSDYTTKPQVRQGFIALGMDLVENRKADEVFMVGLPPGPNGTKVGLDDFMARGSAEVEVIRRITRGDDVPDEESMGVRCIPLKKFVSKEEREQYRSWEKRRQRERAAAAKTEETLIGQGRAINLKDPEAWPEPVDGDVILEDVVGFIERFVVLPHEVAVAIGLWVIHTYLYDLITVSPILEIQSPTKECGKTVLLETVMLLVNRPLTASNISPAAVFRVVEAYHPTLLVDEGDGAITEEIRSIINSGHTQDTAFVIRLVGDDHEPRQFSTWSPKAIALIGNLHQTTQSRAITVTMTRCSKDEGAGKGRGALDVFKVERGHEAEALQSQIKRWATDFAEDIRKFKPTMPDFLYNRNADKWKPLFTIAQLVGGSWPDQARKAAAYFLGVESEADAELKILFLHDLRTLFEEANADKLGSEFIVDQLKRMDHRPWPEINRGKPITAVTVARYLRGFKVEPDRWNDENDLNKKKVRGYLLANLRDVFERYLPEEGCEPGPPGPEESNQGDRQDADVVPDWCLDQD